jgi:predicted DNA-binding protein with PD1-like motif
MRFRKQDNLYVIRFEEDEIFPARLVDFLESRSIFNGNFIAIGAFSRLRIAYFDVEISRYADLDVDEQVEVLSLAGNVARHSEQPLVHAHIIVGRRDYSTLGGHLREGSVRPTLELFLNTSAEPLLREVEPKYGLPALQLNEEF